MRYLIVGSGLFGSIYARELALAGYPVQVIERRHHIAGNIYTEDIEGTQVHRYGPHIFHTSERKSWNYLQQFAQFNHFRNEPLANYQGKLYHLPFNMNTFNQLWGVTRPEEAQEMIEKQREVLKGKRPSNLEEQAISLVGVDIYEKLIRGYTEKQWGKPCDQLPAFIIRRLPVRFTYNNNYFNDKYQGIPIGGYTQIIEQMLDHPLIDVQLNTDFMDRKATYLAAYDRIIYTGMIDAFFDYQLGALAYRSLKFETKVLPTSNYQGNAVINYTDRNVPYTRVIEHQHFEFQSRPKTVVTWEYPAEWQPGEEAYYPVNDPQNQALYEQYVQLSQAYPQVTFGGRLGMYRYFDMHEVVSMALRMVEREIETLRQTQGGV